MSSLCVRKSTLALLLVGISLGAGCKASSAEDPGALFALSERDLDGRTNAVPEQPGIVDINSKITIDFDRPAIAARLSEVVGKGGPSRATLRQLEAITGALQNAKDGLPELERALHAWRQNATKDRAAQAALTSAFQTFGRKIAPIDDLIRSAPALRQQYNERFEALVDRDPDASQAEQDRLALQMASEWIETQRASVQALARAQGGYLRMGAWLDRKGERSPIHLPGFDTAPEGDFYEVERWKIALSDDQKTALAHLDQQAKAINSAGGDPKELFRQWKENLRAQLHDLIDGCVADFNAKVEDFATSQAPAVEAGRKLRDAARDLARLAQRLRDKYAQFDPGSLSVQGWLTALSDLHADIEDVGNALADVRVALDGLKAVAATIPAGAKALFDELIASKCVATIENDLRLLAQRFGIDRASAEVEEFSEAMLKLDVTEVPASTEFSLRRTGMREPGDSVLLRMAAGKSAPQGAPPAPEQTLESRELDLELVLPHLETTVGLIFANPSGDTELSGEFQASPSYSVLYKWGSRESRLYNTLFDWGVGLNLCALDFDKDDTPELGIGVVVAGLHNYVQLGYGYNPFEDEPYWFFGINLPLPTWSFPVGGSGATK